MDTRPESLQLFGDLEEAARQQLARDAWEIGLRALAGARAQARESRLEEVGKKLLEDVDRQLNDFLESQQVRIASVLGSYFDPSDGKVTQRLEAFVADEGVLARRLDRYLSPENSVLAETLARQVGETSPLFRRLSPTESDGLIKTLESELRQVMQREHVELLKALDPLSEDGAVSRFLKALQADLKDAEQHRAEGIGRALAALDANDENSLISRLERETTRARQELLRSINPDVGGSPMATLRESLTRMLEEHSLRHSRVLKEQGERQERFERDIRETMTRIEARRTETALSPRGGLEFESGLGTAIAEFLRGVPCVVESTGNSAGSVGRCKKGDLVATFTTESAFAGSSVVFEAKRDSSYSITKALAELEEARENRNASSGVFIMAASHAPETFPKLARHGRNVLVTWDQDDPSSLVYLHAGVMLGLGLVTRTSHAADEGDREALRDIEKRITHELARSEKLRKLNAGIRRNSDQIEEEIRRAEKKLKVLLKNARSTLASLQVELDEEEEESRSPISFGPRSLDEASAALPRRVDDEAPRQDWSAGTGTED